MLLSLGTQQQGEDANSNNIDGAVDEDGNKQSTENNHTCIEMDDADDFAQSDNNREQADNGDDHKIADCDTVDDGEEDADGDGVKCALVTDAGVGSSNTLTNESVTTTGGSSSTVATITPVSSNSTNSGQHS